MGIFLPLFSATSHAVGMVIDKLNFNATGVSPRALMVLVFSSMFVTVALLAVLMRPELPSATGSVFLVLGVILTVSFVQNIFEFKGVQAMELHAREPISDLLPIVTAVVAYVVFPSERNDLYLLAIVLGVLVIYLTNFNRLAWRKIGTAGSIYVIVEVILAAVLYNVVNVALALISPFYIALFRLGGVLCLSLVVFRTDWKEVSRRSASLGLTSGVLFGAASVASLFSIQTLGLNFTILVLLIGPGLIYLLSRLVLRERVEARQVIGSAVILAIIIGVELMT